jgi:hypothetical protein
MWSRLPRIAVGVAEWMRRLPDPFIRHDDSPSKQDYFTSVITQTASASRPDTMADDLDSTGVIPVIGAGEPATLHHASSCGGASR